MELIIALVLFVAIVVAWLVLPGAPPAKDAGHGVAPVSAGKAGRTV